jgi:hypothetical protein
MSRDKSKDAEVCALYKADASLTIQRVADRVGTTYGKAKRGLLRNGVKLRSVPSHQRLSAMVENRILGLSAQGADSAEVRRVVGVCSATVRAVLKRNRQPKPRSRKLYPLTDAKVREMRIVGLACKSYGKIGRMFDVRPNTARLVCCGLSYKHVPMPTPVTEVPKNIVMLVERQPRDMRVKALYVQGQKPIRQVAERLGITISEVIRSLDRSGVEMRPSGGQRKAEVLARVYAQIQATRD